MSFILSLVLLASLSNALEHRFEAKNLDTIKIQNSSGKINFVAHNKPYVLVRSKKISSNPRCKLELQNLNKKLLIKNLNHSKKHEQRDCKTNFNILLPSYYALDIKNGLGDLSVDGMKSSLSFRIGLGNVKISNSELTKASGVTGKGQITANHLMTGGKFRTGKGDIFISYIKPPQKGQLDLKTGSGNATIELPRQSRTNIKFKSALGNLKSEITNDLRSPFSINMKSGLGNLNIKKRAQN